MKRGRRIAFDYGDVRIGVAVSDPDSILSSPLTTLKATDKNLNQLISVIFSEVEPVAIYVGRPALLSGEDGAASEKASNFQTISNHLRNFGEILFISFSLNNRGDG